jgi:hypothetical protein
VNAPAALTMYICIRILTLEAMTLLLISGRMKNGATPAALQAMHEFQ